MSFKVEATVEDLLKVDQKAEIVNGEILIMSPTGSLPGYAAAEIFSSLREYSKQRKYGRAVTDNNAFVVNLPYRKSFSPDAAFYVGADSGMKFYEGAPVFAVEVRSEGDYGPRAERAMAAGFYLGFTGPITYKNADQTRRIAGEMPLDRMLIETDGPFLTPVPHRGKRNEPAYIPLIAERLASLRQMTVEELAAVTTANAERLFGI